EIARLKQLLIWEQNNHRAFRYETFTDPEFKVIIERRQRESSFQRTQEYQQKLLLEVVEELERDVVFLIGDTACQQSRKEATAKGLARCTPIGFGIQHAEIYWQSFKV